MWIEMNIMSTYDFIYKRDMGTLGQDMWLSYQGICTKIRTKDRLWAYDEILCTVMLFINANIILIVLPSILC